MAPKINKRKAVEPGAFLAGIKRDQSAKRREVNDIIRKVRAVYIPTTNDDQIAEEIDSLLSDIDLELDPFGDGTPPTAATRGGRVLLVTGDAGAGKTRALAKAFLECTAFRGFNVPGEACALLSLVAPSPFTLAALGNDGVRKVGYVGGRQIPEGEVWPMLRNLMRELGIRILHIDEAQHGDQITNPVIHQNVENTLKRLLQEADWPLWLILSGLPELARFCQDDRSVMRRVRHVRFDALSFPDDVEKVRDAITAISAPCGGLDCSAVMSDEFVGRLIHASLNQFGILVEFVQDAIQECLLTNADWLDPAHFADAYMARTGEKSSEANVFEAKKWYDIDVAAALFEQPESEDNEDGEGSKPGGRKRLKPSGGARR